MKRAIYTVSAAGLALLLAAFGPPDLPRERAQQDTWKTWIPEPKPKEPIIAAPDLPGSQTSTGAPKMTHMPAAMACEGTSPGGVKDSAKRFVEAYDEALQAFSEQRWTDVFNSIENASAFARNGTEWSALEQVRLDALMISSNKAGALALIDQLNVSKKCLTPLILRPMALYGPALRRDLSLRSH